MSEGTTERDGYRLRFASQADVAALKHLEDQAFTHDRLSARSLAHAVRSKSQVVLLLETPAGQLVGAGIVHYRSRSRCCRLYSLAVRPGSFGRGLGSRLLAACEGDARGRRCAEMRLEARADSRSTLRFYATRGYRKLAMKPRYYEDGGNAFSFSKEL
jgi:[ribosomal protein S18]-alanine N-acetyltransferase